MKRMKKTAIPVILTAVVCCAAMAVVDSILRPPYFVKSAIKIALFLGLPLVLSLLNRQIAFRSVFRFRRQGVRMALALGAGVYVLILGGYFLLSPLFDFSKIAGSLSENAGVDRSNFLPVSLYISFVNSLLEEFFFRGFLFSNLKSLSRPFAYGFSSLAFSLYHVAMMLGWFSPLLFALVLVGLAAGGVIFNLLNEKLQTVFGSWLVHMFANFAINTIGFLLL